MVKRGRVGSVSDTAYKDRMTRMGIMKFAANVSLLYGDLPADARLAAAAADGFRHVEMLAPYNVAPLLLGRELSDLGLELVLINTPPGGPDCPMGVAGHPDLVEDFRAGMAQAAAVCDATGCRRVHVMAGHRLSNRPYQQQIDTLHHNLSWAHTQFPELCFDLEALNARDVEGYLYSDPVRLADMLDRFAGLPVGLQFDFYHVVKEGLDIATTLATCFSRVVHVQVAGAPHRNEPRLERDGVEVGFRFLHEAGYDGYVGLEYRPGQATAREGLTWLEPLLERGWASF